MQLHILKMAVSHMGNNVLRTVVYKHSHASSLLCFIAPIS